VHVSFENDKEHAIVPIQVSLNWLGALRQGMGSRHGPSQEWAGEWLHPFLIEVQPCSYIKKFEQEKDDDDDFDDEDEKKDDAYSLVCKKSFRDMVNPLLMQRSQAR
jgi:hypothetical protein